MTSEGGSRLPPRKGEQRKEAGRKEELTWLSQQLGSEGGRCEQQAQEDSGDFHGGQKDEGWAGAKAGTFLGLLHSLPI